MPDPGFPAPTGAESAAFDRWAQESEGIAGAVLMEAAGRAAADAIDRLHPRGPVVALVGDGNNGGDALVLARTLAGRGREIRSLLCGDRAAEDPLLHGWDVPSIRVSECGDADLPVALSGASVLVDGILGTGIRGAPRPAQARCIEAANDAAAPVVALDIPSGVDADTGVIPGAAIEADQTLGFGWLKLGTLLQPGRSHSGRLLALEIGFPAIPRDRAFGQSAITAAWVHGTLPRRDAVSHKGRNGSLTLVAGGPGMAGAAVIAGNAAVRSGAGLVRVATWPEHRPVIQAAVPEAIFVDALDEGALAAAVSGSDAIAVGPGLGTSDAAASVLGLALSGGGLPTVLDADALNLVAAGAVADLRHLATGRPLAITPHPGEMRRLLAADSAGGEGSEDPAGPGRVELARKAAVRWGTVVLLKGSPSVVASPDGPVRVGLLGSSALATAGMGDALTGVLGGLLAQGPAPADAAAIALYLTGAAAQLAGAAPGLTPTAIAERVPDAILAAHEEPGPAPWPGVLLDLMPVP